jgi:predicted RNA-binding protein with TRAM domain
VALIAGMGVLRPVQMASAANPPTSSLSDNFAGSTLDTNKWQEGTNTTLPSPPITVNGQLNISTSTGNGYSFLTSKNVYSLRGSSVTTELLSAGDQTIASAQVFPMEVVTLAGLNTSPGTDQGWQIMINQGSFAAMQRRDILLGDWHPYNPAVDRYFRISESGGTIHFATSPDDVTWNEFYSYANPGVDIDNMVIRLTAGNWNTETRTTTAVYGNVNVSPVPGAPTAVNATAAPNQATVSFSAPSSDGGAAISGYSVTATDSTNPANGGETASGTSSPITVGGLTNGESYTFTVTATNANGTGPVSIPSNSVVPSAVPDAPTGVTGVAGDSSAAVSWTPGFNEGSAITSYSVSATDNTTPANGGQTCTYTVSQPENDTCTVSGLTDGDSYTFTVSATNANGTGAASSASSPVTPSRVPDAPTGVTATAANNSASVSFTPGGGGGSTITGYTVTAADNTTPVNGGQTASGASSPITVSGLTNGDSYTFTVTATNANGTGPASVPSNSATPVAVPDAPTGVSAVPGNSSAAVSWNPAGNEGSTILSYQATASPGGASCTYTVSQPENDTCTVTGLTNGTAYTFTVTATNANGTGANSSTSSPVTPSSVPDAPTSVTATPAASSAAVKWNAAGNEGSTILSYQATASPGGASCTYTVSQPENDTCTVTGLTNGTAYTFTVRATNANGTGANSSASSKVTPSSVPDAPTSVTATPAASSAAVKWNAAGNEGSTILSYRATASPGGASCTYTVSKPENDTCTVTGLTNGTAYTFTVTATNANGTGAASAPSNSVTPVPAPTINSFSPLAGRVGTVVTIVGANLSGAIKVAFGKNGPPAAITTDTATKIVVVVPAHSASGNIFVTTPSGTSHSLTSFIVLR